MVRSTPPGTCKHRCPAALRVIFDSSPLAKRYVANRGVEEVPGQRCFFEALRVDDRIGIELRGDACGNGIELDSRAPGARVHALRHQSKEVADSYRWFEDVRACLETEPIQGLPHRADNLRRCVVSVRSRSARRCILLRAQDFAQFAGDGFPFPRRIGLEYIGQRTPTGILRKEIPLFDGRVAIPRLD